LQALIFLSAAVRGKGLMGGISGALVEDGVM
jgi:hypothetical protein